MTTASLQKNKKGVLIMAKISNYGWLDSLDSDARNYDREVMGNARKYDQEVWDYDDDDYDDDDEEEDDDDDWDDD
jgi:hypothetical protein